MLEEMGQMIQGIVRGVGEYACIRKYACMLVCMYLNASKHVCKYACMHVWKVGTDVTIKWNIAS